MSPTLLTAATAAAASNTSSSVWKVLGCIAAAGAVGGLVNALMTDNAIVWPKESNGALKPGVVGNVIIGAFAAVITWGLYGPLKDVVIVGQHPPGEISATLTITALVGAALAGAGGARVITNEIDKKYLRSAATAAAKKPANATLAASLATASPEAAAEAANAA